ncbi:anti-repressor SinI family protein, partial [Alicyclobacillus hesperidum]
MTLVSSQTAETDNEWIQLMISAREMGLSTTEIRSFVL